jgi:F-type H+-transporting ATPase subunit c
MVELTSGILAEAAASGRPEFAIFGAMIGCGMIIIGAALGISLIGSKAVESIARQPEAGGRISMTMIIAGALVEGVTFFALLICFLGVFWMRG